MANENDACTTFVDRDNIVMFRDKNDFVRKKLVTHVLIRFPHSRLFIASSNIYPLKLSTTNVIFNVHLKWEIIGSSFTKENQYLKPLRISLERLEITKKHYIL